MKTEKKKIILKMLSVFLVCGYAFVGQTTYLEAADGPYASNLDPADGAMIDGEPYPEAPPFTHIWTMLTFSPGSTAVKHTGYFSDDYSKVYNRHQDANLGQPPFPYPGWDNIYFAGNPEVDPAVDTLVRGTTYYWTVDETDAQGNTFAGDIWEFTVMSYYATNPDPPDGATNIDTDVLLSWRPGYQVDVHDVYIGTSWGDVNNANEFDLTGIYQGWTIEPNWPCSGLPTDTKIYWRVDEVHDRSWGIGTIYKGDVWSFTTIRREATPQYPADGEVIDGEPYPEPPGSPTHIWTMLIFNPGSTAVKHTGYFSDDYSKVYDRVEDANLGSPPYPYPGWDNIYFAGNPDVPPAIDSLVRGTTYYWCVDETDAMDNTYPGDIWEFTVISYYATNPDPSNEAININPNVLLSWRKGYQVDEHDIYFGTSFDEVNDGDYTPMVMPPPPWTQPGDDEDWDPVADGGLTIEFGTTYYWRVDAIHSRSFPGSGTIYKGDVWSFTTRAEPDSGLVGWWKFDEGSGAIAYDSAGTNDGTINGASWTTGKINSALSFDGVDDYVDVGNDSSLMTTGDLTIYAWIKARESRACIYSHSWSGWGLGFGIGNNNYDGRLGFYTMTHGHWIEAGGSLADDTWHQVAATLEGTMVRLFTDSIEIGSDTGTPAANLNGIGLIGLYNYAWFFGGIIDDVRIYDRALSEEEIGQLFQEVKSKKASNPRPADSATYVDPNVVLSWSPGVDALSHDVYLGTSRDDVNDANTLSDEYKGNYDVNSYDPCGLDLDTIYYWRVDEVADSNIYKGDVWSFTTWAEPPSDLVGWWKFDEGEGSIAYDSAGTNDGTIHGATWTTGQINGALSFDGSNDYVSIAHNPELNITGDITIAAWVFFRKGGSYQAFVTKCVGTGRQNTPFDFRVADRAVPHLRFVRADASGHERVSSSTELSLGEWRHVLVRVENKVPDFYVDGVITGKFNDVIFTRTPTGNTKPVLIGRRDDGLYFDGLIDDARIYDRALSEEEIWEVYQSCWCEQGRPCINVWPETLEFYADQGGSNPEPQILSISNFGDDILNFHITEDCSWLEVDPNAGSSAGEPNEVTVSVDILGLDCGLYECDLIVSDPNASNNPQIVNVQLEVFREDCQIDVRVAPVAVLTDPASTSEVRTMLPDSMAGVVRGSTYYIEIWASDVGATNTGLTGVYADVDFCNQTSASAVEHGTIFVTFPDGTIQPSGVDEFGGSALPSGGGIEPEWVRVGWIQMSADFEAETCTISLLPSSTGIAALDRGLIPWTAVDLGSVELEITPPVRSYDLDEDDFIGLADLSFFAASWKQRVPPADEEHDFDCDGFVGVGDLSWFATGWQKYTNDPTILYPPCSTGAEAMSILNNSALEMQNSDIFQTSILTDIDIAFSLAVLDSPSSSDTAAILPTSVKRLSAGQTYYLELWVSDSGYVNTGLTSAYVDMSFPANAATVTDVSNGGIFMMFTDEVSVLSGKIDELGGSSLPGGDGIEPEWARVAIVEILADATLPFVTFTLSPSSTGVAALGRGTIPWDDISLDSLLICPADFDNDSDVDEKDLAIFSSAWRTKPGDLHWDPDCDISIPADNFINEKDLAW
ncbi:MAG: LamG domain-containing protein [Planctomycetota bacterium]|jgi:hypothetical protein